jgi:hypothetical protein
MCLYCSKIVKNWLRCEPDILGNGGAEEHRLLAHNPNLIAEPADVDVLQVHAVQADGAGAGVVEALDELDDGALAAAAGSHQRHGLVRLHGQAQAA